MAMQAWRQRKERQQPVPQGSLPQPWAQPRTAMARAPQQHPPSLRSAQMQAASPAQHCSA
jgi:hypothetical protein